MPATSMCHPRFFRRSVVCLVVLALQMAGQCAELDPARAQNLIILDPISVENIGLETAVADDQTFEQLIFAVGRMEPVPSARAAISSPTAGRVLEVKVAPGDAV